MLHLFSTLRAVFPTSLAANVTSSNSVLRGSTSSQSMYSKMSKRASWSRWTDFPLLCQKECNPPEEPCHYQCQRSPTSSMNFTSSICIRNFEQTVKWSRVRILSFQNCTHFFACNVGFKPSSICRTNEWRKNFLLSLAVFSFMSVIEVDNGKKVLRM